MKTAQTTMLLLAVLSLGLSAPMRAAGLADAQERLFKAQFILAQKGDADAQYHLGEMYELGLGTAADLSEAYRWYGRAAAHGHALAKKKLTVRSQTEEEARAAVRHALRLQRERAAARRAADEHSRAAADVEAAEEGAPRAAAQARLAELERQRARAQARATELERQKAAAEATELARKRAAFDAAMQRLRELPTAPFE